MSFAEIENLREVYEHGEEEIKKIKEDKETKVEEKESKKRNRRKGGREGRRRRESRMEHHTGEKGVYHAKRIFCSKSCWEIVVWLAVHSSIVFHHSGLFSFASRRQEPTTA